jgi:tetratricopeptide (TPR) repeat protein
MLRMFRASLLLLAAAIAAGQTSTNTTKVPDTKAVIVAPTVTAKPESIAGDAVAAGRALMKAGKYADAAKAFQALVDKDAASADAQSGLMESLLRSQQLEEAQAAMKKAIAGAPQSALVHASAGDIQFRAGNFAEAETEYRAALKMDGKSAEATFGMARMMDMVSMHKRAKDMYARAHELDSEDSRIFHEWLSTLPRGEQLETLKKYVADHPSERDANRLKYLQARGDKRIWALESEVNPTEIKMLPYGRKLAGVNDIMRDQPKTISKGYGLSVKFNDSASAVLLLDTGAGGITIGRKLAEKAGAVKIGDTFIGGIGDEGPVRSYVAWVDKISIGSVQFRNCVVVVSNKNDVADEAGLSGPDVFEKFLITLDFHDWKLLLAPLPKNPAVTVADDDAPQDRYIAPELQGFTKFYRFYHDIVVPVVVNDKATGNFILDTGADLNIMDLKFAQKVTRASADDEYRMKGVSGKVSEVLTGQKAILMFARMRIESHDLPVFALDSTSASEGTEIAGLVGIRTLVQTKMTIDYRDGLVNLEPYTFKQAHE